MVMDGITQFETEQIDAANTSGLTPVVFVHGLWLLPNSWDHWRAAFAAAGYATLAPGWPDDPETVKEGNEHPERFAGKTVGQIADHMEAVISKLSKPPALIGHSFGGLLVQILAGRGLSKATVAIDPAPFQGVLPLPVSALKSASPVLKNPTNYSKAVALTFDQFRYAFAERGGRGRGQRAVRDLCGAGHRARPVPGGDCQLQSVDRREGRLQESEARTAAGDLRREGPHGSLGDRECQLQEAEAQRGRHRDRRDPGQRPLVGDRQRLEGSRRHRTRVRGAVHQVGGNGPRRTCTVAMSDRTTRDVGSRPWPPPS